MNPMSSTKCFHICECCTSFVLFMFVIPPPRTESAKYGCGETERTTNNELFECILCLQFILLRFAFFSFLARIYPLYFWYVFLSLYFFLSIHPSILVFFFISCSFYWNYIVHSEKNKRIVTFNESQRIFIDDVWEKITAHKSFLSNHLFKREEKKSRTNPKCNRSTLCASQMCNGKLRRKRRIWVIRSRGVRGGREIENEINVLNDISKMLNRFPQA